MEASFDSFTACSSEDAVAEALQLHAPSWKLLPSDFTIMRSIGNGAYGNVFLGQLNGCGSLVAVKKLNQEGWQTLAKEVHLLVNLSHPCIVRFMGVCVDPPALLTEHCEHGSLYDVLKGARNNDDKAKQLNWRLRLRMAMQGAEGMAYLHDRGVLHRDLKSPNLLIDRNWEVRVADFGLARRYNPGSNGHVSSPAVHPVWMAPEVMKGEAFTPAADVYSFGIIMWELLTMEMPFDDVLQNKAGNVQVIFMVSNEGQRPPVPEEDAVVGGPFPGLQTFIALMNLCWAQEATQRCTFKECAQQLRELYRAELRRAKHAAHARGKSWDVTSDVSTLADTSQPSRCPTPAFPASRFTTGPSRSPSQAPLLPPHPPRPPLHDDSSFTEKTRAEFFHAAAETPFLFSPPASQNLIYFKHRAYDRVKMHLLGLPTSLLPGCAHVVGIKGMGGIGKTTVAQAIVADPEVQRCFPDGIFWVTISRSPNVFRLLQNLWQQIMGYAPTFANDVDGHRQLYKALLGKSVLLVLDDVWDVMHLNQMNVVSGDSCILATSRDQHVLESGSAQVVAVEPMAEEGSLQLLCLHAFNSEQPPESLVDLVSSVVHECKGLPLALKVIGSSMRQKGEQWHWEHLLQQLRNARFDNTQVEVLHRLRLSYDVLEPTQQDCLLDFAAFPEDGRIDVDDLMELWMAVHGMDAHSARWMLEELSARSLVDVEVYSPERQYAHVHDLMYDFAVNMIAERNKSEAGGGQGARRELEYEQRGGEQQLKDMLTATRLFYPGRQLPDWLVQVDGTRSPRQCEVGWNNWFWGTITAPFHLLDPLVGLGTRPRSYVAAARKVSFVSAGLTSLSPLLTLANANALLLGGNPGLADVQLLTSCTPLRALDLSNTGISSLCPLTCLPALRLLKLDGCTNLRALPLDISVLTNLRFLHLRNCTQLQELPATIGSCHHLSRIKAMGCRSLESIPDSLGSLSRLTDLRLGACYKLTTLPTSLSQLAGLQTLALYEVSVASLAPHLAGLTSLRDLIICRSEDLLDALEQLRCSQLTRLHVMDCSSDEKMIHVMSSRLLSTLPLSLWALTALEHLELWQCHNLQEIPDCVTVLQRLAQITLLHCHKLQVLPSDLGPLSRLRQLELTRCYELSTFPSSVTTATSLSTFIMTHCHNVEQLPDSFNFAPLQNLQHLALNGFHRWTCLPESLTTLSSLTLLSLKECRYTETLPAGLGCLTNLRELDLSMASNLRALPESTSNLCRLRRVGLHGCQNLVSWPRQLEELTELQLDLNSRHHRKKEAEESSSGHLVANVQQTVLDLEELVLAPNDSWPAYPVMLVSMSFEEITKNEHKTVPALMSITTQGDMVCHLNSDAVYVIRLTVRYGSQVLEELPVCSVQSVRLCPLADLANTLRLAVKTVALESHNFEAIAIYDTERHAAAASRKVGSKGHHIMTMDIVFNVKGSNDLLVLRKNIHVKFDSPGLLPSSSGEHPILRLREPNFGDSPPWVKSASAGYHVLAQVPLGARRRSSIPSAASSAASSAKDLDKMFI